jgi:hypothetical protein
LFSSLSRTSDSIPRSQIPKERYMNRAEWMGNKYKDNNLGTYDWVPEIFTTITPSPEYHNKATQKKGGIKFNKYLRASEGMDSFKNSILNLEQKREKQRVGRLMTHFKYIGLQNQIRYIRA